MRISEIQTYKLDGENRVELPDNATIIAVDEGVVTVEIVVERYNLDHPQ
jgi:hypothetical protein